MSFEVTPLRLLADGGNGDLYLGRRSDTGDFVVIKFLRECHVTEARKAFGREVRILLRQFPGLVPILFARTEAPRPFYVMPYFPGGTLATHAGRLSDAQLRTVAIEIAEVLANLHAVSIAHGDVKPQNTLVSNDGHMRVADPLGNGMGCTVLFSEHHGGTPGYWAPEVREGGAISPSGDVYSYGATLYHMATGSAPREGDRLDLLAGSLPAPAEIRDVVTACCQIHPRARPSMPDVLRMLRGERWAVIQQRRAQDRGLMTVGALLLLALIITK